MWEKALRNEEAKYMVYPEKIIKISTINISKI
jgi:hypothetical protein